MPNALTAAEAFDRYRARFNTKYLRLGENDCWAWQAQIDNHGYGRFRIRKLGIQLAHVAALVLVGRKIPRGEVVDHKCRNRICVNPNHLRVVTFRQNTLENSHGAAANNAAKTQCIHGHPFSGHNLIQVGKRRQCRACLNQRVSVYHKAKRLADGMVECLARVPSP